ncbi:rCG63602 [Rattus norvegicus]|uniref:RCG63602 n=1 Tax=Rattus norvegicus TaxID=10116 RepID=A6JL15_RAT|nr:rCG63602 [Rattus norvegicus]
MFPNVLSIQEDLGIWNNGLMLFMILFKLLERSFKV